MKIIRIIGGVLLTLVTIALSLAAIGGLASGDGVGAFAGFISIILAILTGQLSAMCFSKKYTNAIGERDRREIMNQ